MKIIFSFILMIFSFCLSSKAQYTFISYDYDRISNNKMIEEKINHKQIYNVSLTDNLFIHNVFSDENSSQIEVSQIYTISEQSFKNNVYYFTVVSGVTGNSYYYGLRIKDEDANFYLFDDESRTSYKRFNGYLSTLKTYTQDLK